MDVIVHRMHWGPLCSSIPQQWTGCSDVFVASCAGDFSNDSSQWRDALRLLALLYSKNIVTVLEQYVQ
jgi:hypothetical protein